VSGSQYANRFDRAVAGRYEARAADWRNGAVIYQVFVDRFAPSADLGAKAHLYPAPKRLHSWDEVPQRGAYLPDEKLWAHEIDFWGGDLASTTAKLGYITSLGADVLYLNPVHLAYTNHKYDALDYADVSPEYGTRQDVLDLAAAAHGAGLRFMLDGVFNHMGRNSDAFKSAESDPNSPYRDWFVFGPEFPGGARSWWLAENLPELNLENPAVREHLFNGPDSIVRRYLREGVDGWRLDVAVDIGMVYLDELTSAAHTEKPDSVIIGEIAEYPKEWFPSVDGVINFALREVLNRIADGYIGAQQAMRIFDRLYTECDYEHMLKSWNYLDNHDTPRSATRIADVRARRIAQLLQFTLPGSPNIYYGSELGMTGADDPEMRAPMRWDWVNDENVALAWHKQLINLHQSKRALRVGDFRLLETNRLIGFERYTDRVEDSVIILANPSDEHVTESVLLVNSKYMHPFAMNNLLDAAAPPIKIGPSMLQVEVPAKGFLVLAPEIYPEGGYTSYKRVQ
jgi:glycosidase